VYQVSEKSEVSCHFSCWAFMEWPICQILFCRAVPCRGCDPSIPNHQHGCWHYYCTDLCRLWCTSSIRQLE